jgi:hypothetical protein
MLDSAADEYMKCKGMGIYSKLTVTERNEDGSHRDRMLVNPGRGWQNIDH